MEKVRKGCYINVYICVFLLKIGKRYLVFMMSHPRTDYILFM